MSCAKCGTYCKVSKYYPLQWYSIPLVTDQRLRHLASAGTGVYGCMAVVACAMAVFGQDVRVVNDPLESENKDDSSASAEHSDSD